MENPIQDSPGLLVIPNAVLTVAQLDGTEVCPPMTGHFTLQQEGDTWVVLRTDRNTFDDGRTAPMLAVECVHLTTDGMSVIARMLGTWSGVRLRFEIDSSRAAARQRYEAGEPVTPVVRTFAAVPSRPFLFG